MKDLKKVDKELIDKDTGEIVLTLYEGDNLVIHRESQKEAIKKSKENKKLNNEIKRINKELGGFVFVLFKYSNVLLEQHPEITQEDITKLFYLSTYVDYDGNLIFNNKLMSKKNMQNMLQLSKNAFYTFFNKMENLGIFICKNNNIIINKSYFMKGDIDKEILENYDYTRIYIKSIRYLFENVPKRQHRLLGNYFKLLPYAHRQTNILCWNPDSNEQDILPLSSKDLQNILSMHRHTIESFINKMLDVKLETGESIIIFVKNNRNNNKLPSFLNPKVLYGGNFDVKNDEYKTSLIYGFKQLDN